MLVLTRGAGQAIDLYDGAGRRFGSILVTEIRPGWVKIGLDLPRRINVLRGELPRRPASEESRQQTAE